MHRHGYQGRKFGRKKDQRQALMTGLVESLIIHESIETTLHKAKELVPAIEVLITKAKKGDLHSRRQIIASLHTTSSAHKLVDELAPKMMDRNSGHVRISRTRLRRGDNTQMATVSLITEAPEAAKKTAVPVKKTAKVESATTEKVPAPAKKVKK